MLLSQKLFQKLDSSQSEIPPSLEQVYQRLISEKLLDFPDQTEAETSSKASAEKYPLHDKNYQMPPKISLSKAQYVRLLRMQAEAIIEYYKIDKEMVDCIGGRSLSNSSCIYDPKQPIPFNMAKYENFEEDEPVIDRTEAVAMKAFDKQFKKHVHIKIDLNSFYFYKTQAKYKLFLNQHIQQNFINDGAVFSDFFDVTKY